MDSVYAAFSAHRVWEEYRSLNVTVFDTSELRLNRASGVVTAHQSTVHLSDLSAWTEESPKRAEDNGEYTTLLRLVWVERNKETMQMHLSQVAFSTILDAFNLRTANEYYASQVSGATRLHQNSFSSTAFIFSYHPKLAVLWSQIASQSTISAIVLSTKVQIAAMKALLNTTWSAVVASHVMFPLLLSSLLLSQEVNSGQGSIKKDLREVEVRTGYHRFANRSERPASGDLGELSARMSGCATKLASIARKIKTVEEACEFMCNHSCAEHTRAPREEAAPPCRHCGAAGTSALIDSQGEQILHQSVELLRKRLKQQETDNDYIIQRVRIQINALFNLITQNDSLVSLKIAQASQLSAMSNQHDSSSMKTLAVVTMLFLPGSFVSSLFSVGFFNWNASTTGNSLSVTINPGFGLYWAVAVPLTIMVFAAYALWMLFYKRKQRRLNVEAKREAAHPLALEEVKVLSIKRGTFHEKP